VNSGKLCIYCGILGLLSLFTACTTQNAKPEYPSIPADALNNAHLIDEYPALAFTQNLKIGLNLGNSLDATAYEGFEAKSLKDYEESWGNPATTKKMLQDIQKAGFNTVRIPTSWGQKTGPAPDYAIDPVWMDRVQEVVNYAYDLGLYVILNVHHDNEWLVPLYEKQAAAQAQLEKTWAQIAQRFADYDQHLIFEGMNEPRLVGHPEEWNEGTYEARDVINQFGAAFVKTVRSTGGKNAERYLMVPAYAASGSEKALNDFVLPENDDHLIVSVHAYSPYNFALNNQGTDSWGSVTEQWALQDQIDRWYKTFVQWGIPVVVGEFGALNKNNTEARANWAKFYVERAKNRLIPCVWWDNNSFEGQGENFGLYDRQSGIWRFPEIVKALMEASSK